MNNNSKQKKIKVAEPSDYFFIELCAKECIDLIKNFKKKFKNNDFFILTAYYENNVAGVLVSEKNNVVKSIKDILPAMQIHFVYVNPAFRGKRIGYNLLNEFVNIQKKKNIALIFVELFKNNKKGMKFFEKFGFQEIKITAAKIILTKNIWDDLGISSQEFFDIFT